MEYDKEKVDEAALALMWLVMHGDTFGGMRAWKGLDWDILDRLHEKGMIENPVGKAKSVAMTDEGVTQSKEFFKKLFGSEE